MVKNISTKKPLFLRGNDSLITLGILSLLITGGLSWMGIHKIETRMREDISVQLKTVLATTHEAIQGWAHDRIDDIKYFARRPDIRELVKELLALRERQNIVGSKPLEQLRELIKPLMEDHNDLGFFVISPGHINVASMRDRNIGAANLLSKQGNYLKNIFLGKPQLVLPLRSDVPLPNLMGEMIKGEPTMFVGSPIYNNQGTIIAAITIRIDPSLDFTRIAQIARGGETGDSYAIDKKGRLVTEARFDDHLIQIGLIKPGERGILNLAVRDPGGNMLEGFRPEIDRDKLPLTRMAKNAVQGQSGLDLNGYRDYRGVPVVGAWLWDKEFEFGLTYEIDVAEAYQSFYRVRGIIISVLSITIILFVSLSTSLVRRNKKMVSLTKQLSKSKESLSNAQKIAHIGNWDWDILVDTALWSDETYRIFGVDNGKLEEHRQNFLDRIHPDDKSRVDQALSDALSGIKEYNLEYRIVLSDNVEKVIHARAEVSRDDNGKAVLMRGTMHDITKRKQAEEERQEMEEKLRQTQKLESLGVLAGGIAHDFNNILTGILGNAEFAMDNLSADSPSYSCIEEILKGGKRAAELSNQMLAYSGKGKFLIENIDVNKIIKEMIQMLGVSISKKHKIKYDLTDNIPSLEVDITQIRQVIMNLIINASEAIGENSGIISITTGSMECDKKYFKKMYIHKDLPAGHYIFMEVADTGVGIDKGTIEKIFDPFFTTKFTGRGLGMSVVLGIIRGHKGAINIESKPDKGTKLTVFLPASRNPSPTAKPVKEETAAPWRGSGTVLVVDDEEMVREVGKRMLERIGCNVITAGDGQEAVEIFRDRSNEIDCVLLDLTMPRMNGEECFHELRKIQKDIRVIIYSGYSNEETAQKFINQGVNEFLQKPFNLKTLRNKMRKVFESNPGNRRS